METNFDISDDILSILHTEKNDIIIRERFYAQFLFLMNIVIDAKMEAPAGFALINGKCNLYINPELYLKYDQSTRKGILKHECLHFITNTPGRLKNRNKQVWNIATDCAINQLIEEFDGQTAEKYQFITVESLEKMLKVKLERNQTADYYYEQIKLQNPDIEKMPKGFDEHGDTISSSKDGETQEVSEEFIRQMVEQATMKAAKGLNASDLPNIVSKMLEEISNRSKTCWKRALRNFIATALDNNREFTRSKRNRRYGLLYPGKRNEPTLNIMVGYDFSGSIDDKIAAAFHTEVGAISNETGATIKVCEFDTEIHAEYDWKPNLKRTRSCSGGTLYQPILSHARNAKVDGVIVFGDMQCFDGTLKNPNIPVLWAAISENDPKPAEFGRKVVIKL